MGFNSAFKGLKKCVQKMNLLPASGERNVILAADWL